MIQYLPVCLFNGSGVDTQCYISFWCVTQCFNNGMCYALLTSVAPIICHHGWQVGSFNSQ